MHNLKDTQNYYGKEAYSPSRIPQQHDADPRGLFARLVGTRLPWGNTEDVVPIDLMMAPSPEGLRFWAESEKIKTEEKAAGTYKPGPYEDAELHSIRDHECFRFSQLPASTRVWLGLRIFCKWSFILVLPLSVLVDILLALDDGSTFDELVSHSITIFFTMIFVPPWLALELILRYCPKEWLRLPHGPMWELNRITGMVTIFDKPAKGKDNTANSIVAPFYEFDAYIVTSSDRQGLPLNNLMLRHRYNDAHIDLRSMFVPDSTLLKPSALWDFFQNYMDMERPLHDAPLFEAYRHLDPVTAAYDKQTGRNPEFWINMDTDTFNTKLKEMGRRISNLNTLERPNLMARYVSYAD